MKKNNSPAFQFYPNEWLSSTKIMLMSAGQEGAYIRLLSIDWQDDGIPDNLTILSRLTKIEESDLALVLEIFIAHPKKEGYLHNVRLQKERVKQKSFSKERSESGKAGAKKRWQNAHDQRVKGDSSAIAQPMANDSSSSSISSSISIKVKDVVSTPLKGGKASDLKPKKSEYSQIFEDFWKLYPARSGSKVGKKPSFELWQKGKLNFEYGVIVKSLEQHKQTKKWKDGYIPDPARWLRNKGWEDDAQPDVPGSISNNKISKYGI